MSDTPRTNAAIVRRYGELVKDSDMPSLYFEAIKTSREIEADLAEYKTMCAELAAQLLYHLPTSEPLAQLGQIDKHVLEHQKQWRKGRKALAKWEAMKKGGV